MIATFCALFCYFFVFLWFCSRWVQKRLDNPKGLPLPPGPKPLLLIGNLYDMSISQPWVKFAEWSESYGGIIHVEVFGTHFIYINHLHDARNLFEKRSALYSDKPKLTMAGDVVGWDWALSMQPYGSVWRKHRRLFHQYFHASASNSYQSLQLLEARRFVSRLLELPDSFAQHALLFSASTIMRVVYGTDIKNYDDEFIKIAEEASESITATGIPGKFLVDVIPVLRYVPAWFPGAGFQRLGKEWKIKVLKLKNIPFDFTKDAMRVGDAPFSVVSSILQRIPVDNEDEEEVARSVAGVAYAAGNETTVAFMLNFLLAMLLNPASQKKAQDELDAVLGSHRLPEFNDLTSLPYVEAIVMETLRWHPILPIVPAHKVTRNDEYNGYFIPKGSIFLPNAWAMLHDENVYPNPEAFTPERFLDENGKIDASVPHPKVACFGFGRRICPGRYMGYNSIFIAAATILAVLNIEHALDEDGTPIPVKDEMEPGFVWIPKPFKCLLKPRTSDADKRIRDALHKIELNAS